MGCVDGAVTRASCTIQADRVMLLGKVGTATATGGQIQVFIDDLPTTDYPDNITPGGAQFYRSWLDGVAFVEAGTPLSLQVTINRDNGQLSLANNTGGSVAFTSLSITSASQALLPANWTSITTTYDQGGALDTDAWEVTAPTMPFPTYAGALTEIESAGAGTLGATLASGGSPINLGNIWKDTRFSDVQLQMTLVDGTVLNLTPTYTGTAHLLGDLSNNGSVGLEDYLVLSANLHTNVSTLGQAEAYLRGDMNGDRLINHADFVAFRAAFPGGSGAFDAMVAQVPEPGTAFLVVVAAWLLFSLRSFRRNLVAEAAPRCPAVASRCTVIHSIENTSRISSMIHWRRYQFLTALVAIAILPAVDVHAVNVTMNTGDTLGNSSFNVAGNWSNAAAPSAGNSYFTGNVGLRTPADVNSYTFGGDSLRVNNTNFDPLVPATPAGGLWYKGTGTTGVITINNLILDGGLITHISAPTDLFQLAGNINVVSNSYIQGRQGAINILANISGTGSVTNPSSDGDGRIVRFMSPNNTYSGSIVNNGRFELSAGARMNFAIGASGVNNSISGAGPQNLLNGDFNINLTGASSTLGNSWTLVSATNRTFGDTFNIPGFTEFATGSWVKGNYQFSEATGMLTVAPPPDLLTLRINTTNGQVSIVNATAGASFDMNYYEVRSASGSLNIGAGGWNSIDGNVPASTTTWEKAGGSTANLISETNLLGMSTLNSSQNVGVGAAYAGTLPAHQDLRFFYGTKSGGTTLFGGFVEYVTSSVLLGDFNGNGKVDAADYTLWRNNLGAVEGSLLSGNGNGGTIDQSDYNLWKSNFGMGGSGSLAGQTQSIPEPATLGLLLLAACCGLVTRRSRQA